MCVMDGAYLMYLSEDWSMTGHEHLAFFLSFFLCGHVVTDRFGLARLEHRTNTLRVWSEVFSSIEVRFLMALVQWCSCFCIFCEQHRIIQQSYTTP